MRELQIDHTQSNKAIAENYIRVGIAYRIVLLSTQPTHHHHTNCTIAGHVPYMMPKPAPCQRGSSPLNYTQILNQNKVYCIGESQRES